MGATQKPVPAWYCRQLFWADQLHQVSIAPLRCTLQRRRYCPPGRALSPPTPDLAPQPSLRRMSRRPMLRRKPQMRPGRSTVHPPQPWAATPRPADGTQRRSRGRRKLLPSHAPLPLHHPCPLPHTLCRGEAKQCCCGTRLTSIATKHALNSTGPPTTIAMRTARKARP